MKIGALLLAVWLVWFKLYLTAIFCTWRAVVWTDRARAYRALSDGSSGDWCIYQAGRWVARRKYLLRVCTFGVAR